VKAAQPAGSGGVRLPLEARCPSKRDALAAAPLPRSNAGRQQRFDQLRPRFIVVGAVPDQPTYVMGGHLAPLLAGFHGFEPRRERQLIQ
jgi:hypothetical protein